MSTLLVTGGAGFVGTNFVRLAAGEGDGRLLVLDALTYAGNLANIEDLVDAGRVRFVHGDICDGQLVRELFHEHAVDRVVHFAAESHVDRSIRGPGEFLRTNIDGTYTLLESARFAWGDTLRDKRFVHVSTDEVYGALGPEDPAFHENTPYQPNSPYSASKAASDHLARAWHHTYGLPTIITHCSNNYGPWQFPEKLIPLMILNALEGRPLPVYGDGRQIRDWLHVEDHCRGVLATLERGRPGESYLFGGQNEWANIDLVRLVCAAVDELLGHEPGTCERLIEHVADRPGHDRRYAVDPRKAHAALGWHPRQTFAESVPRVASWYLEHREWARGASAVDSRS